MALSTTGLGLGAAAAVTTVSTSIVEHFSRSSEEMEASGLLSTSIKEKVSVGARCLCALGIAFSTAGAAAKSLQSCPTTLCDPTDGSHQAPLSLGFSRQEHWSGLPFPSPMHESEK